MKGTVPKYLPPLLAVLALTLMSLGIFFWVSQASPVNAARPDGSPAARGGLALQQPDNSQCLGCHGGPGQAVTFPDGSSISITVDPDVYGQGVHNNLACQVCHTNITDYPHPPVAAGFAREYTLQYENTCNQCHPGQAEEFADGAHARLAEAGNPNTPICADCHDPHTQAAIEKEESGDPAPSEHVTIAETCSKCHAAIVDEYRTSVHGEGVFGEFNPDVPACHDCHGIHNISTARSVEYRLNSPQLCANCHTRPEIMDKYGLSTDVLDTYVSDFHGTTVTLFERTSPDLPTNKPVCYDCHGVHNILATDHPEKGIQVRENMLAVCQRCHPDATENFPASWMSHYIASPDRFPLVFYVQWFYRLFIPAVLGGMGLYVLTDVLRKLGITRRGKAAAEKATEE
jgi:hypothetical protein